LLEKAKVVLHAWKEEDFNYLSVIEIEQAIKRVDDLLEINAFPQPGDQWLAVPWPIF
jgi:hypothetical protein